MKIEIENYKGWDISFDTNKEAFYCHSELYDKDQNKTSYSAVKKFIDDFIKDNQKFNPVWIQSKPGSHHGEKKIKLIGIRKDGRFIYENSKGEKKQLSDYNEKDYILYDEKNDKFLSEADALNNKIEEIRLQIKNVLSNVTGVELTEYKKQLTP